MAAEASADDKAEWRTAMPIIHAAVDHLLTFSFAHSLERKSDLSAAER
jgi:hypothetical protein